MAQYDGTIRINTKIDSDNFLKGLKKMSSQSKKLNNSISETTKEIDRLQKEIKDLQTAPLESSAISRMSSECDILEKKLIDLLNKREVLETSTANSLGGLGSMAVPNQAALDSLMKNNGEWKKLTADIDKTELALQRYENKLKQAKATEQKKTDSQIEKKAVQLEKACNKLDVYKTKLSEISGAESGIAKQLSHISSVAKKGFTNVTKHASKSNSTLNKLSGTVTRFTKRVWGVLSSALVFSVLTKAFTALREKMAAAVKQNAQFSASMAQISGNLNNVFNNLLSAAMPALNTIMSAIAKATSYLNAFVALLTGKTIKSSNAAANAANNQATAVDGVGEAVKKASEYLNGYDEMNVQTSKDTSSGGGGSGSSDISYEDADVSSQVEDFLDRIKKAWENADFTEFGQIVGDKINKSLESIDWEKNKENGYKLGKSFATFLNGIFSTPDLFTNVGETIADGLNTVINTALGFADNFNWTAAGQAIADSINGFFNTFEWDKSGDTVTKIALGLLEMLRSAIQGVTWESIGADIHDFLANIKWGEILKEVGGLIVDAVCAGIDFLSGLTGLPWEVITAGIATLIGKKLGGFTFGLEVGLAVTVAIASFKLGEALYDHIPTVQEWSDSLVEWIFEDGDEIAVSKTIGLVLGALAISLAASQIIKIPALIGAAFSVAFPNGISVAGIGIALSSLSAKIAAGASVVWSGLTGLATTLGTALTTFCAAHPVASTIAIAAAVSVVIARIGYELGENIYEMLTGEAAIGNLKDLLDMDVTLDEIGQAISDGAIVDLTLTPLLRWVSGDDSITTQEVIDAGAQMIEDVVDGIKEAKDVVINFVYDIAVKIENIKQKVKDKWNEAKEWIKDKALTTAVNIGTKVGTLWNNFKKSWGSRKLTASMGISTKIKSIWNSVKKGWNSVKTKLTFPIKTPHFTWGSKTTKILGKSVSVPDLSIKWYANGGFPDMGQLFIAREAGAEMVGNIGGKTAVANNDQITTAIAAAVGPAVYDAMMSALMNADLGNGDIAVYVGGQKITDYVIKDVKNRTIASGGINPLLV